MLLARIKPDCAERKQKMILADKIINERKKCAWSQEELAEKLDVSRQAVSKWESAQAMPDIQKILKMAEIFGVSTDYLLKDELEPDEFVPETAVSDEYDSKRRRVSIEEANAFLHFEECSAGKVANAVMMCIVSPVILLVLSGLSESSYYPIPEGLAASVGLTVLFALIAAAVYMFISYGMKAKQYEYMKKEAIETAYGVDGLAKEKKKQHEAKNTRSLALGVILCVLSVVPVIIAGSMNADDTMMAIMTALLLVIASVGVNMIVRAGIVHSSYDVLLQENGYSKSEKAKAKKIEPVMGAYWCLVTAGYLGWSFISGKWDITWIVWPVAGVLSAVVAAITKAASKEK